jgi:hypothetical protein
MENLPLRENFFTNLNAIKFNPLSAVHMVQKCNLSPLKTADFIKIFQLQYLQFLYKRFCL